MAVSSSGLPGRVGLGQDLGDQAVERTSGPDLRCSPEAAGNSDRYPFAAPSERKGACQAGSRAGCVEGIQRFGPCRSLSIAD